MKPPICFPLLIFSCGSIVLRLFASSRATGFDAIDINSNFQTSVVMTTYSLANTVDLSVYFDADAIRYDPEWLRKLGVTREFFIHYYKNCPSLGFLADGVPIGGMILDADRTREVHFAVLPEHHGKWQSLWPPALAWLFAQQDPVDVSIEKFNKKCIRFMDRNQWERLGANDSWIYYRMTAKQCTLVAM